MKFETQAGLPTKGLLYSQITEKLRELEELFAMMGHLVADEDKVLSHGWLGCSELTKKLQHTVTEWAAKGRLN